MNRKRLLIVLLILLIPAGFITAGAIKDNEWLTDIGVLVLLVFVVIGWKFGQDSKQIREE